MLRRLAFLFLRRSHRAISQTAMISEDERRERIHLLAPIKVAGQEVGLEVEFHGSLVDGTIKDRKAWMEEGSASVVLQAILKLKELVRLYGKD